MGHGLKNTLVRKRFPAPTQVSRCDCFSPLKDSWLQWPELLIVQKVGQETEKKELAAAMNEMTFSKEQRTFLALASASLA